MKRNIIIATAVVALGLVGGGLAFAQQGGGNTENDAVADLAKAKVTLSQAISVAESQSGGRAVKAELEGERGATVFNVEVVTADSKVLDVTVDAADGKVLSSKQDQADRGGKEGHEGSGHEDND